MSRNRVPKDVPDYRWNYALGLYKDLEGNRKRFNEMWQENRIGQTPPELPIFGAGGYADPTALKVQYVDSMNKRERRLYSEILSVDLALCEFDTWEKQFFEETIRQGKKYDQSSVPLSNWEKRQPKKRLVKLILWYLDMGY